MSQFTALIMFSVAALLIVVGVLVKYGKCYFLISGYNTMSPEKKKNVDVEGLGRFLAHRVFIMAGLIVLGGVSGILGYLWGPVITFIGIMVVCCITLIGAQKFDGNTRTPEGKTKPSVYLIVGFIILIFAAIVGMTIMAARESHVDIDGDVIRISGIYGAEIPLREIEAVRLTEEIPVIKRKTHGFDFGPILKGYFSIEGIGRVKLILRQDAPPFVWIRYRDEWIIVNYKEPSRTRRLYLQLTT